MDGQTTSGTTRLDSQAEGPDNKLDKQIIGQTTLNGQVGGPNNKLDG